jgi:hypothetical protein
MDKERYEKLRAMYEDKTRNVIDLTVDFWTVIKEMGNDVPDITLEELRQLALEECCRLYRRLPGVDVVTNLHKMFDNLDDLINEVETITQLEVSGEWKKGRLLEEEIKLGTLLGNISNEIIEHVGASYVIQDEVNEILAKETEKFMDALSKEDIYTLNINMYYCCHMIPFYRNYHKIALEALNSFNNDLLWQIAIWSASALVLRSILMTNCLNKSSK